MRNRTSETEDRTLLRILCLNYEYPPVGGGGGRAAAQINAGLAARGHEVRVQTAGLTDLPKRESTDGVEIFRSESFRKKRDTCTVPEMALFLVTSFLPTLQHIREWKPDVIHAHFAVPTGALALVAHVFTGIPYVLTAHLGDVPGGVPQQTTGLFRFVQPFTVPIWKRAAAITAVSTFVANLAEHAYHRRPTVIPNGIRLAPRPTIEVHNPVRILWVGRLSEQKNPVLAVKSLALLRDLPWSLEIIGDGPLRPDLVTTIQELRLEDRVRVRGWLDSSAVADTMSASDILLMTSHSEGLPMVAIEALNHGLAIVSTDIPGVADVIEDGTNGSVAAPNPDALGTALRALIGDPIRLASFREAAANAAGRFEVTAIVDSYEEVLVTAAK